MQAYISNLSENFTFPLVEGSSYIIYFSGCNFKCPSCNSSNLLEFKNENQVMLRDLKKSIEPLLGEIKSIRFTGGEPTLQRQALLDLARFAKQNKLKVILDTNGSKPETIKSLISSNLIDIINFDLKSPLIAENFEKVTKSQTFFKMTPDLIQDIRESLKLIKESKITIEIKTVVIPSLMFKKEDILEIAEEVNKIDCIWNLTPFNPENVNHKYYKDLSPPTDKFIENLKEFCLKKFPKLKFRDEK